MTKTLSKHLQSLKDSGQGLVIPYIMAGDHEFGLDGLFDTIHLLADAGASAIEIGVPFSDPVAMVLLSKRPACEVWSRGPILRPSLRSYRARLVLSP